MKIAGVTLSGSGIIVNNSDYKIEYAHITLEPSGQVTINNLFTDFQDDIYTIMHREDIGNRFVIYNKTGDIAADNYGATSLTIGMSGFINLDESAGIVTLENFTASQASFVLKKGI